MRYLLGLLSFVVAHIFVTAAHEYYVSLTRPDLYQNTLINYESPQARIIGGTKAQRRQFPYQVSILYTSTFIFSHICGGSLIHPKVVLSAAHCKMNSGRYKVGLGLLDRYEINSDNQYIFVDKFIVHPLYPGGVAKYDVGVLILRSPAELTEAVKLISLPTRSEECDVIQPETLSGWGLTQNFLPIFPPIRLQYAVLPRVTLQECKDRMEHAINTTGPLDDTMVCTVTNEGERQSACSGDSGGPLAYGNTIIGVVSWGVTPCADHEEAPSVYTNVCSYRDWINEEIIKVDAALPTDAPRI